MCNQTSLTTSTPPRFGQQLKILTILLTSNNLRFTSQARLWVQVLRDMRTGVKLKKVEFSKTQIEYEMTPYEIMMDDIK